MKPLESSTESLAEAERRGERVSKAEAELTAAVAAERERCARVAEEFSKNFRRTASAAHNAMYVASQNIAKAIRAQS